MTQRRQLNRERVIGEAARLADEAGDYSAVSLTVLARALNVRPPSLYNHVSSLEDLQYGMAALADRRLLAELRQAAQGRVGRDALTAIAHAHRRFAKAHPGIYPLTIRAPRADQPDLIEPAQELLQLLLFALASMGLTGDDALHAVRGLRALLHGFVSLESAGGFAMDLDVEESYRRLVEGFFS